MDALMVDKGDPWHPSQATIEQANRMCREVSRVLAPDGLFVQISFEQVHFRRPFLMGAHVCSKARKSSVDKVCCCSDVSPGVDCCQERKSSANTSRTRVVPSLDCTQTVVAVCCCPGEEDVGFIDTEEKCSIYGWTLQTFDIQRQEGCFGHFLYAMRKRQ